MSVCDVGPRDGLQNDNVTLEPATRAELCTRLAATGLTRIEAASFVHPKLVPQMAGAEEVFAHLPTDDGVAYSSLVLNRKGLDRALATVHDRDPRRLPGHGDVRQAQPEPDGRGSRERWRRRSSRRAT